MNISYRPTEPNTPVRLRPLALQQRVRDVCRIATEDAAAADATGAITEETWLALCRSGLPMAPFPVAHGGEDLLAADRVDDLVAALRLIGGADLALARLVEGHINAVALVCRYGTAAQIKAMARAVADGGLSGVWGADDAAGLRTVQQGDRWRLTGRKILASGAGFVTHPVVTATTEGGQRMMLPALTKGERADISSWTAQGMRASATGSVDLTGLMLDDDQVLGQPGDFTRQPHFSGGAWRFCTVHLGAAERLLDLFRDHLTSRGRAGDPYQLQRVAACTAATTTAAFWIEAAADRLADDDADPEESVAFVNLTRMVTERAALDVLEAVHRGVGLGAFIRPHPIERISRDLSTYLRQPVPDLAMADAARAVLASPRPASTLWSRDGAR